MAVGDVITGFGSDARLADRPPARGLIPGYVLRAGYRLVCLGVALSMASACGSTPTLRFRTGVGPAPPVISAINGEGAASLRPDLLNRQLAAMHSAGIVAVRSDAAWAKIEPEPPRTGSPIDRFASTDAWVRALANHGLTWLPIIDYSVWWAATCSTSIFCPPANDAAYARFARAVAARYGDRGTFWARNPTVAYRPARVFEIWNEENSSSKWAPGPDPAAYGKLYMAARSAIKSVDPQASVIVGGLGEDGGSYDASRDYPSQFVTQMLAAHPSLRGAIDGFGLHPYAPTATDVIEWVVHFRRTLDRLGEISAPIDLTEFGWPAGTLSSASTMRTLALVLGRSNCELRLLAPYDWINPPSSTPDGDFGFVPPNGTSVALRPAGAAWLDGLRRARDMPVLDVCGSRNVPGTLAAARSAPGSLGPRKRSQRG